MISISNPYLQPYCIEYPPFVVSKNNILFNFIIFYIRVLSAFQFSYVSRSASDPTYTHYILTVSYGLHAEAQQRMQEVHNVIERVFVDILAHCLAKLQFVQLIQVGQAVLCLKEKLYIYIYRKKIQCVLGKIYMTQCLGSCSAFFQI